MVSEPVEQRRRHLAVLIVDFFDDSEAYLQSRELGPGDVILLITGGHGFEVLEESEMMEERFSGRSPS